MNKRFKYNFGNRYSNSQICNCINEWIPNATYRAILKRIYVDGITNQEAAEEFGYCPNNIKNIVRDCYPILEERLRNS